MTQSTGSQPNKGHQGVHHRCTEVFCDDNFTQAAVSTQNVAFLTSQYESSFSLGPSPKLLSEKNTPWLASAEKSVGFHGFTGCALCGQFYRWRFITPDDGLIQTEIWRSFDTLAKDLFLWSTWVAIVTKKVFFYGECLNRHCLASREESVRREAHKHGLLGGPSGVCLLRECPSRERERMSVQRISKNSVSVQRGRYVCPKRVRRTYGISRERLSISV